jgi:hypothetical protein
MAMYPKYQGSVDHMSNNPFKYFLNNHLFNTKKPIKPNQYVYLTTLTGIYRVMGVDARFFVILDDGAYYRVPWEHLKCIAKVSTADCRQDTINALRDMIKAAEQAIKTINKSRYTHSWNVYKYGLGWKDEMYRG